MAVCMGMAFVSCGDDDEKQTNNTPSGTEDQNLVNLSDFDLAETGHGPFYVTLCYCGEFSSTETTDITRAIANGTLYMDFYVNPSTVNNYYAGSQLNLVSGNTAIEGFTIEKYDPATQTLWLCADDEQNTYSGIVELTQDNEKIYFKWFGEARFPQYFEDARIEAYMLKSDLPQ